MFSGLHCTDEGQQPETSTWMSAVCLDREGKGENDNIRRNWGGIREKGKMNETGPTFIQNLLQDEVWCECVWWLYTFPFFHGVRMVDLSANWLRCLALCPCTRAITLAGFQVRHRIAAPHDGCAALRLVWVRGRCAHRLSLCVCVCVHACVCACMCVRRCVPILPHTHQLKPAV